MKLEHIGLIADAFDKFTEDNGVELGGHVLHLTSMASELRRLASEGVRGVCWNTTSLADTFDSFIYEGEDGRPYNFDVDDKHVWIGPDYLRSEVAD